MGRRLEQAVRACCPGPLDCVWVLRIIRIDAIVRDACSGSSRGREASRQAAFPAPLGPSGWAAQCFLVFLMPASSCLRLLAPLALLLSACGGGGGGGGDGGPTPTPAPMLGDAARRAVLADIGAQVILPTLRSFAERSLEQQSALEAWATEPASAEARAAAQAAWAEAMVAFQRVEVLQLGPAAMSDAPGGEDRRDLIYAYPFANRCAVDEAAYAAESVTALTPIDAMGLGALEWLLYAGGPQAACPPAEGVDVLTARAEHAARIAQFIRAQASVLQQRWEPDGDDFLAQWSEAGVGSTVYARPQDALDALSTALFYTEKETKDRKIACPTGIGASGLSCDGKDVQKVEFPLARVSTPAIRANVQIFRDVFTGLNGGMGMNDLLRGIDRDDIADDLLEALDATLAQIDGPLGDFETAVESIESNTACINASSSRTGEPACALHGLIKAAMDIFRTEVVGALSLATPDRAAGDND